jgi:hypothetical protein
MSLIKNPDGKVSQTKTIALVKNIIGIAGIIAGAVLCATGAIPAGLAVAGIAGGMMTEGNIARQRSNANRAEYEAIRQPTDDQKLAIYPNAKETIAEVKKYQFPTDEKAGQ